MIGLSYLTIIIIFMIYYFLILIVERKIIHEPKDIIESFLAVVLTFAGISLIYFSFTGKPFLTESINEYYIYTFVMGFIAILWAVPFLLMEFSFFKKFLNKHKVKINEDVIKKRRM